MEWPENQAKAGRPATTSMKIAKQASGLKGDVLEEFTLFPKMPIEVRYMVWDLAVPESPQFVTIKIDGAAKISIAAKWLKVNGFATFAEIYKPRASYNIPAVLHVNRESRNQAKKHFDLAFSKQLGGNPVYFTLSKDILVIDSCLALFAFLGGLPDDYRNLVNSRDLGDKSIMEDAFRSVRRMALDFTFEVFNEYIGDLLQKFRDLQSLDLVARRGCRSTQEYFESAELPEYNRIGKELYGDDYEFPVAKYHTKLQMNKLIHGIPIHQRVKKSKAKKVNEPVDPDTLPGEMDEADEADNEDV